MSTLTIGRKGRGGGFTLIELLVVIAIIAILAAILFPVFVRARAKGRGIQCISNMRQCVQAVQMYADDWDSYPFYNVIMPGIESPLGNLDGTPNDRWWYFECLAPYLQGYDTWQCPEDTWSTGLGGPDYYGNVSSFDINMYLFRVHPDDLLPGNPGHVLMPTRCVMMWDGRGYFSKVFESTLAISSRHHGGDNFGFCDGHVEWVGTLSMFKQIGAYSSPHWPPDAAARDAEFWLPPDYTGDVY